ncbi:PREDICTED: UDP-GlcNAc:betaGal beta-1,3-N-acetylglucosaminyltransferase 6-like, partial [Fulmarus glacialis]|uniref:UDP-GlcNAc:betaGal beta-1,3-N-acetylglucosaminyltransferase 6-like n=1 Tax=Fulmarus glacialis TaxID=30455 RepID=UPI00051AF635
ALPILAPCVVNASVQNISGFATLPGHVQDFMRYQHCRSFPVLLSVPGKCGGPEGSPNIFLLLAIKSSPVNYERCGGGGMLMSGFTARVISRESRHIKLFPIDDVYLGMCLEKAGLLPASHDGIRTISVGVPANADPFDP